MLASNPWAAAIASGLGMLVLFVMMHSALRATPPTGNVLVLSLPRWFRWFAWGGTVVAGGAALGVPLAAWLQNDPHLGWASCFLTPMGTAIAAALGREPRVRLNVDALGIGGTTAYRGTRFLRWCDVETVTWSRTGYWLTLRTRDDVLRVSAWLVGFPAMVRVLRQHVPETTWRDALTKLENHLASSGLTLEDEKPRADGSAER